MALLSEPIRVQVWEKFMRENAESVSITRQDLRLAVNAVDDWLEANAVAANAAIPQPARAALSASQKAAILMYVTARRYL